MGREPVARAVGSLLWGGDIRPFFAGMRAIGEVDAGGLIVDAPCGAGVAFRALDPAADVRYLALDLSPRMLERARKEAAARGQEQIELVEGDATAVPIPDGAADLFLSYWGLHCFDDPEAALDEARRCLGPGGRLVGASFVTRPTRRNHLLVRPNHSAFGRVVGPEQLSEWLEARFAEVETEVSGPFAYFEAN